MKKLLIATSLAAAAVVGTPNALAAEPSKNTATGWKQAGVFTGTTLAGAALGGPVGMFVGAISGAYLGEQIEKADTVEHSEHKLAEYVMQVAELESRLAGADQRVGELSQLAMDSLAFQVLFHTGADQLTERGEARVQALAEFLHRHPHLKVELSGHADPRGTDEYNNVLAQHRALSVQQALLENGISKDRIVSQSYGALRSTAPKGHHEAYALERRVDIAIVDSPALETMVQAH